MSKLNAIVPELVQLGRISQYGPHWQLQLRKRRQLVESIDMAMEPEMQAFPDIRAIAATPEEEDLKLHLNSLKEAWSQLLFTYGLKEKTLQKFLAHHTEVLAEQLPKCKQIVVEERWSGSGPRSLVLNEDLAKFGAERGVTLDPFRDPDEYPQLHELIVEFGRTMCQQYPSIFRDLYLLNGYDISKLADDALDKISGQVGNGPGRRGDDIFWDDIREPSRKLLQYLELTQDVNHWYRFTESSYSGLRESYFWYIRTLPETPFDPIAQSDTIDSSIQLKAWEHAGLLFGAEAGFRLGVKEGPLPSPIIYQLSPGDLQTGPP